MLIIIWWIFNFYRFSGVARKLKTLKFAKRNYFIQNKRFFFLYFDKIRFALQLEIIVIQYRAE